MDNSSGAPATQDIQTPPAVPPGGGGHARRFLCGGVTYAVALAFLLLCGFTVQQWWGLWGVLITEAGFVLIALAACRVCGISLREALPLRPPGPKQIWACFLLWLGAYCAVAVVTSLQMALFPRMVRLAEAMGAALYDDSFMLMLGAVALAPAVCEEILFRGFFYKTLGATRRPFAGILIVSALFGILHLDPLRALPTALLGGAITYAMYKTRNLALSMFMHGINNLLPVLVLALIPDLSALLDTAGMDAALPLTFGPAVLGGCLMYAGMALVLVYRGAVRLCNAEKRQSVKRKALIYIGAALLVSIGYGVSFFAMLPDIVKQLLV